MDDGQAPLRGSLSRRGFARLCAAASASAMLASGCRDVGGVGGRGAVHLRFWNGFTGPDGTTMLGIIRRFNALRDDVQVTMQRVAWDTYYNKVFVAGLGGRAPEVFVVQVDHLERFIWGKLCAPVDSLFDGPGSLDPADFDANILATARRGDATYALPLDVHPMGVFYNKRLFAEAGIARPPADRDEFLAVARKLRKGGGAESVWGYVYEWLRINLYAYVRQWDADIISRDDLRTCIVDSPAAAAALDFAAGLIEDGLASPIQNTNALIGFRQGRVGMVWCGTFILNEMLKQPDLEWGAAVLPQMGARQATWAGSHMLCLRTGLGERERAGAETFVKYLSDQSLDWAEAGQVPVRPRLREDEKFKAMECQSTFARQIPYAAPMPSTTFTREYQIAFDTACERVLRGSATSTVALATAAADIRAAAARFAVPAPADGGAA